MKIEGDFNNSKIARNSLIVYAQLFVTLAVNLITARLVLQALGASDYGLYNVVGGLIGVFSFLSSSMSATTTRFLNYEMGKKDGNLSRVFNISNVLHITLALSMLIIIEIFGTFYICNYLNVEQGKETDAMFVFQLSTIIACVGVVNVPFQSIFIAHEKFGTIATVEITNVIARLLMVISMFYYEGEVLRYYAIGMGITTFISFVVYHYLSYKNWSFIVKWNPVTDIKSYKDQLFFSNWNTLGTASLVARGQGSALLINYYFGTVVNAAYAIGDMILAQVNNFIGRFDSAVAPQIIKNIGSGNIDRTSYLVCLSGRISILLMEVIVFPLFVELNFFLRMWLGDNIPEGTLRFCELTLILAVVSSTTGGLVQYINGSGKIKWFKIMILIYNILPLIAGSVLFGLGAKPQIIVLLYIISDIINRFTQLYLLRRYFSFDVLFFIKDAYFRPLIVFFAMFLIVLFYQALGINSSLYRITGVLATFVVILVLVWIIGLKHHEKRIIYSLIVNKIIKCNNFF